MDLKDNTPDLELITSKEDLFEKYNILFTKEVIDERDYYFEIPTQEKLDLYRVIVTPSGIVAVSSLKLEQIWEIDSQQNQKMLHDLDIVVERFSDTEDIRKLTREFRSGTETYFLRILPYNQVSISQVLRCILDERLERVK